MPNSMPPTWQIKLGKEIKTARLERKYPQKKLAAALNVRREMIRLYEKGKTPPPLAALRQIAQELRTTFSVDGIVLPSPAAPSQPEKIVKQKSFDFQGEGTYVGATVRISVSKERFEVTGYLPDKAVNA